MAELIVPPGGFAGFAQMVPAQRASLFPGSRSPGRSTARRRRRKSAKRASGRTRSSRKRGTRKLKFGSPAFQKYHGVGKYAKKRRK